jgi:hypothetical protein
MFFRDFMPQLTSLRRLALPQLHYQDFVVPAAADLASQLRLLIAHGTGTVKVLKMPATTAWILRPIPVVIA